MQLRYAEINLTFLTMAVGPNNLAQEWLYDEGEDARKAAYIQKYEELRSVAGIIAQRYFDHEEEKRQKNRENEEAESAKRAAELRQNQEGQEAPGPENTDNMVD